MRTAFLSVLFSIGASSAFAQDSCAKASLEGACPNLKVTFDLSKCSDDPGKGGPAKVSCSGETANASYSTDKYAYSVEVKKTQKAWGEEGYQVVRSVRELIVKSDPEKAKPVSESASAAPEAEEEIAPPSFSGFVDFVGNYQKEAKSLGFSVYDAALYASHEIRNFKLNVDLPFAWVGEQDDGAGNISYPNDFKFATGKAQAYVTVGFEPAYGSWTLTAGQFDTIYGFELNDSADRFFPHEGLLYTYMLPTTHTGMMIGFSKEHGPITMTAKALAANRYNQGAKGGENVDFGGQLGLTHEMFRTYVGYLTTNLKGAAGFRHFIDVLVGGTFGKFSLDTEFDFIKEPGSPNAFGIMGLGVVQVLDPLGLGLRGEYTSKAGGVYRQFQISGGFNWKILSPVTVRGDYSFVRAKATKLVAYQSDHRFDASLVYRF